MQSTTTHNTHEAERAAMSARYKAELRRGVVPSVYIPRPDTSSSSKPTSTTTKQVEICSACGKPRDRKSLPGYFILVSLKCCHSFCSQCCLKLAGKTSCPRRECKETIPSSTQHILATQKRNWAIDQALQYCNDDEHAPLSWHNPLKSATPCYDKAVAFLQNEETASSLLTPDSSCYIEINSLRPHLVGFANLLISMRNAEAHLHDLDDDPTDLLRQRKWRYTVMALDHFLENQAKQRKRCTASMLAEYMQPGANQVLDEMWGIIDNLPNWIISPTEDEDVKLLFDFVVQLCRDEAAARSLKTMSTAVVAKMKTQLKSLRVE